MKFKKVLNFLSVFMAAFVLSGCAAKAKFDVPQIVNFDKREFEVTSQSGSNFARKRGLLFYDDKLHGHSAS